MLTHSPNWKPNRVVILGGSGFLGKALSKKLISTGTNVLSLSSKEIDLTSEESVGRLSATLQDSDTVVFISTLTPDRGKDNKTFVRNIEMGRNFCDFLNSKTLRHIVYVSSDAVYGELTEPISEKSLREPNSTYGLVHTARELMITQSAAAKKIPLCILRPVAVYGADDSHNSYGPNQFSRAAEKEGKISIWGNGEEIRDHIYVDDVIDLISKSIEQGSVGQLNLATGEGNSFEKAALEIIANAKKPIELIRKPRAATTFYHRHFDISNLIRSFPNFKPTSLKAGIRKMVQF